MNNAKSEMMVTAGLGLEMLEETKDENFAKKLSKKIKLMNENNFGEYDMAIEIINMFDSVRRQNENV